jgi:hypothetical protein
MNCAIVFVCLRQAGHCNGEFLIAKREAIPFSSFGNLPEDAVIQVTLQYFHLRSQTAQTAKASHDVL